jgi:ribose transport system permease protein
MSAGRTSPLSLSGGAAALGGIIDSSRVLSASSSNGGTALTFTVLAGIAVGGDAWSRLRTG